MSWKILKFPTVYGNPNVTKSIPQKKADQDMLNDKNKKALESWDAERINMNLLLLSWISEMKLRLAQRGYINKYIGIEEYLYIFKDDPS